MGLTRKLASVSTLGAVDFRSDKERIARYTKASAKTARRAFAADALHARHQQAALNALVAAQHHAAASAPAGRWAPDPWGQHEARWWNGQHWTKAVLDQGVVSDAPMPPPG